MSRDYEELDMGGHKFPQSILEQINENSKGGFFLAWVDENDSPTFFCDFDNEIVERALLDFTASTVKTIRDFQSEVEAGSMIFPGEIEGLELNDDDDDDDYGEEV